MRTSIGLQPEPNAPVVAPLQRDQADVASDHRMLELVLDHAVGVAVAWKRLEITSAAESQLVFPPLYRRTYPSFGGESHQRFKKFLP